MGKLANKSSDPQDDGVIHNAVPWWTSYRLATSIVSFFGCICYFGMRVNMSVAIVCMTEGQPNDTEANGNNTEDPCGRRISTYSTDMVYTEPEFDWSRSDVGWVLSAFFWGYVFTQFPGGWLANRIGAKMVIGGGMVALSVLTLLTPLASRSSVYALMAIQALKGLASGVYVPAYYQLWGRWAPPKERAFLVAFASSGYKLGSVVGYSLSGYLCQNGFDGGWPSIFYVFGAASLVWCAIWFVMVYSNPAEHPWISKAELEYMQRSLPSTQVNKNVPVPWKSMFTSRPVYGIFIANSCYAWCIYVALSYTPMYLNDVFGIDIQSNGFYSSLPSLFATVVCIVAGIMADVVIRIKLMRRTWARKVFQSIGCLPGVAFSIGMGYLTCRDEALAIVLLTLWVGLMGFLNSGSFVNIVDIAPRFSGVIMGIDNTIAAFPGIIVPPITSAMTRNGTVSEWQNVFLLCAAVFLLGWVAYMILADATEQEWAQVQEDKYDNPTYHQTEGEENAAFPWTYPEQTKF